MSTQTLPSTASDQDQRWLQLVQRDAAASFFYGVATTGIFCRPGCASRLPLRTNVRFFADATAAKAAGFRPCQRCRPDQLAPVPLAEQVLRLIDAHLASEATGHLTLASLGKRTGRSPFAVQRAFAAAFALTPAQYLRRQRAERLARELAQPDQSITDAIHAAGYSSSSRAYTASPLAMTPGSIRRGAACEAIDYALLPCDLGHALAARTPRGLCWLAFGDEPEPLIRALRQRFHSASLTESASLAETLAEVLDAALHGRLQPDLPLDLRGTAFQLRVWAALRQIPRGETRSYSQIARDLGQPRSTRAVARACATNSVALLVPCHRVLAATGALTGYRWGLDRKRAILAAEAQPR